MSKSLEDMLIQFEAQKKQLLDKWNENFEILKSRYNVQENSLEDVSNQTQP